MTGTFRSIGSRPELWKRGPVLAALAPSAVLFLVTMAGGGVVTFLPIERFASDESDECMKTGIPANRGSALMQRVST